MEDLIDITPETVAEIKRMLAAVQGPLQYTTIAGGIEEVRVHHAGMLDRGGPKVWHVFVERDGEPLTAALTGNGPTSEAHAQLFANAPKIINSLLARLDGIAGAVEALPLPADRKAAGYARAIVDVLRILGIVEATDEPKPAPPQLEPTGKRIIARFHPQAWIHNAAVECDADDDETWDVTDDILALPLEEALALRDHDTSGKHHDTDFLSKLPRAPEWVRHWHGPYWVEVEGSIKAYFAEGEPPA